MRLITSSSYWAKSGLSVFIQPTVTAAKARNKRKVIITGANSAPPQRFFRQAAWSTEAGGLDARRFAKASTHWMRHTFVRQALVHGMPIEVASELTGRVH